MYYIVLVLHNLLRWVVLALAAVALARAYRGWLGGREWSQADRRAGLWFTIALDVQLVLGLGLLFLSPLVRAALPDLGAAMAGSEEIRFLVMEHVPVMIAALVVVHGTAAMARRANPAPAAHRRAALGYTLALIMILLAVPWWRPLLPF